MISRDESRYREVTSVRFWFRQVNRCHKFHSFIMLSSAIIIIIVMNLKQIVKKRIYRKQLKNLSFSGRGSSIARGINGRFLNRMNRRRFAYIAWYMSKRPSFILFKNHPIFRAKQVLGQLLRGDLQSEVLSICRYPLNCKVKIMRSMRRFGRRIVWSLLGR